MFFLKKIMLFEKNIVRFLLFNFGVIFFIASTISYGESANKNQINTDIYQLNPKWNEFFDKKWQEDQKNKFSKHNTSVPGAISTTVIDNELAIQKNIKKTAFWEEATPIQIAFDPKDTMDTSDFFHRLHNGDFVHLLGYQGKKGWHVGLFYKAKENKFKSLKIYLPDNNGQFLKISQSPTIYIRPPAEKKHISILKNPGNNWLDCENKETNTLEQLNKEQCLDKLSKNSKAQLLDAKFVESFDPETGNENDFKLFYLISYQVSSSTNNTSNNVITNKQGWIHSEFTSFEVLPDEPMTSMKVLLPQKYYNDVDEAINRLDPYFGVCLVNVQEGSKVRVHNHNAFENIVLNYWQQHLTSSLLGVNHVPISSSNIVAIDTLARTIYGEIASTCYKHGIEYLMGVAAVVQNRARVVEDKTGWASRFSYKTQNPLIDVWSNVLTHHRGAIYQFSVWQPIFNIKSAKGLSKIDNPSIPQILCPPRNMNELFYMGEKPYGQRPIENWKQSLKVALMAVQTPNEFEQIVNNSQVLYYTDTYINHFNNYIPYWGTISKKVLNHPACIKFWKPTD